MVLKSLLRQASKVGGIFFYVIPQTNLMSFSVVSTEEDDHTLQDVLHRKDKEQQTLMQQIITEVLHCIGYLFQRS